MDDELVQRAGCWFNDSHRRGAGSTTRTDEELVQRLVPTTSWPQWFNDSYRRGAESANSATRTDDELVLRLLRPIGPTEPSSIGRPPSRTTRTDTFGARLDLINDLTILDLINDHHLDLIKRDDLTIVEPVCLATFCQMSLYDCQMSL
jgi:hypothetical protein